MQTTTVTYGVVPLTLALTLHMTSILIRLMPSHPSITVAEVVSLSAVFPLCLVRLVGGGEDASFIDIYRSRKDLMMPFPGKAGEGLRYLCVTNCRQKSLQDNG